MGIGDESHLHHGAKDGGDMSSFFVCASRRMVREEERKEESCFPEKGMAAGECVSKKDA